MLQPLVWQRRKPPPQQATTGPALMEGVEKTNMVVVREQGIRVFPRRDLYAVEVDHGRNCYACEGFGHMTHHCRSRGQSGIVEQGRRVEYEG